MGKYVEFQDLRVRVNTGDPAVNTYTGLKLKTIDPDGNSADLAGEVDKTTWIGANLDKAKLLRGWWRFAAEAINTLSKERKTKWYKLWVDGTGEVTA